MEPIVFKTLKTELDSLLEVKGKIPTWLKGTLLRNGPAKFEQQDRKFLHWFDGYAMLHKFTIQEGKVMYRNRFLVTDSFKKDHSVGEITVAGSGTLPTHHSSLLNKVVNLFKEVPLDNTNVNIIDFNDRTFAVSDFSRMIEFDFSTLETKGEHFFRDEIGDKFSLGSAHPCVDINRQEMYNFVCKLGPVVQYKIFCMDIKSGKRKLIKTITRPYASMIHSTALTPNYYIFIECPEKLNFWDVAFWEFKHKTLCQSISWDEKETTNFYIINRKTHEMTVIHHDPFFFFHTVNAYEEGDKIMIDLSWAPRGGLMNDCFFDKLLTTGRTHLIHKPARFEINLAKKKIEHHFIGNEGGELAQIHPQLGTQKYKYAYFMGMNEARPNDLYNQLLKLDMQTGKHLIWHEDATYPSEPVFVPKPDAQSEDEGCVLSVVIDSKNDNSFLLVLDGQTFEEISRVNVPHLIPMGFHGKFYPFVEENEFERAIKENLVQEGFTLRKVFKK